MTVQVYWGVSGSGKSHEVFVNKLKDTSYYTKQATTKWFDSYKGEKVGVIDEFRGVVDIAKVLTWFDKWPAFVETKGGQVPLLIEEWHIMSNVDPRDWYMDIDQGTRDALMRRLTKITHFGHKFVPSRTIVVEEDQEDDPFAFINID